MSEDIVTGDFLDELGKRCDNQAGVVDEYANPQAARVHFRRAMQARGYRRGGNHTWTKPRLAVVMEPN